MKKRLFVFLVLLSAFLLFPKDALALVTKHASPVHIQISREDKNHNHVKYVDDGSASSDGEGMFAIGKSVNSKDAEYAFCLDGTRGFNSNQTVKKHNALKYMSQNTLTKMAIYREYFYNVQTIVPRTKAAKYYFTQIFVWNILLETGEAWSSANWRHVDNKNEYGRYVIATKSAKARKDVFGGVSEKDANDLQKDIISKANKYYEENKNNFKGYGEVWKPDNGSQPLITLSVKKVNYDYSIDAACENCDSTNTNGSYLIQDINNWDNIFASPNATSNAKNYYKKAVKGCNVFCREEYKVVFPNQNNQINVEAGRYFTVNKQTTGNMYKDGVPNFKPIKVIKTRECRVSGGKNENCLKKFAKQATTNTKSVAGKTGKITLKYNEKYENTKYNSDFELVEDTERTSEKVNNNGSVLTAVKTVWYKLPSDTYRYVDTSNNLSMKTKPTDVTSHYIDMGTENLPISLKNYSTDSKKRGANITLKYSLPTDDTYSKLNKAFNAKNNYFGDNSNNDKDNIYKENKNTDLLKKSACAKLYGYKTSKYETCRKARFKNKAGNCYSSITGGKYICDINVCKENESLCLDGKCHEKCPPITPPKCEIIDGTYYGVNGSEVTESQYNNECGDTPPTDPPTTPNPNKCVVKNGKYYGQDGKEVTKDEYYKECPKNCKVIDGKYYYGKDGNLTTKSKYESECGTDWCKQCNGGKCCPDTDMVCPDENGECPTKGGNKIIYRTIDLNNPFPAQSGMGRDTGSNWCSYNVNTKKYTCVNSANNRIVDKHILKNREQKGYAIYNTTPMYEFTLDTAALKAIKKYNKNHDYNDESLKCNSKGICYSKFLRSGTNGSVITRGTCKDRSDLATCAEVKS